MCRVESMRYHTKDVTVRCILLTLWCLPSPPQTTTRSLLHDASRSRCCHPLYHTRNGCHDQMTGVEGRVRSTADNQTAHTATTFSSSKTLLGLLPLSLHLPHSQLYYYHSTRKEDRCTTQKHHLQTINPTQNRTYHPKTNTEEKSPSNSNDIKAQGWEGRNKENKRPP